MCYTRAVAVQGVRRVVSSSSLANPSRSRKLSRSDYHSVISRGVRLSCQIRRDQYMTLRAVSRFEGSGRADLGPTPSDEINPPPIWVDR